MSTNYIGFVRRRRIQRDARGYSDATWQAKDAVDMPKMRKLSRVLAEIEHCYHRHQRDRELDRRMNRKLK